MNTARHASPAASTLEQASDEDLFGAFARLAGAQDHDDLVRRERDCAEFERRCAAIPLLH